MLAEKATRQALISMCQEFINDPYFKFLKQFCEVHSLQPIADKSMPPPSSKEDEEKVSPRKTDLTAWTHLTALEFDRTTIRTHICRTFKVLRESGIEVEETSFRFGFKRTFEIDSMGGPPKI